MLRFALDRLISGLLTAWLVATLVFVILRLVPGDPATTIAGPEATAGQLAYIRTSLGLEDPLPVQYGRFLAGLGQLDLGMSIRSSQPVMAELMVRFPATLELTMTALLVVILVSVPLGALAARGRDSLLDHASRVATLVGVGMPVFWSGLLLAWLFSYQWRLLPGSGRLDVQLSVPAVTGFAVVDALLLNRPDAAANALSHLVLPTVVLALPGLAISTRLMRASLLEVLGEDYVRTARAKGLHERAVLLGHALRNALGPVLTLFGLQLVTLLSGAILVESVFAWPGIGTYVFDAIQTRDYPIVQGAVILIAVLYVAVNTAVDLAYGFLDPRIRVAGGGRAT